MPKGTVHNDLSGAVSGPVVQAGSVEQIHFHDAVQDTPVPSQLPSPSRFFTSRERELADLERWLAEDEGSLLVVISGAGGVGKTTLALRWLHNARDRFPDGQLYVDLGAFSTSTPVEPADVLEWFLLALGVPPHKVPVPLAQREALYRTLTADRQVAVLLDNALSAAQVRPLLPASSRSVAVVTSRWRLAGLSMGGAHFIQVDPLDVADSVELLKKVVGNGRLARDRQLAEELARLCGGLPIALSVVGARLSAHPNRSLSREVGDLRGSSRLATLSLDDQSSVEVVFDMSYEDLPLLEAQVYRLCALHPGEEFGAEVVAAVLGRSTEDIECDLEALVDRYLLTEVADRRFRYHDLLLLHAQQQAEWHEGESMSESVVRRMVEWYLDTTVTADLVLRPTRRRVGPRYHRTTETAVSFGTHAEALRWLEQERGNVLEAARTAVKHGWDDLVWEFCEALWGYYLHYRPYSDWIELHHAGIPAAQRCENPVAEARLRVQLGFALGNLRRYDEAIEEYLIALRLADQEGDQLTRASTLVGLARSARGKGELHDALEYLREAKEIQEDIGTERAVAVCRHRMGEVLGELHRYEEAVTELQQAAATMAGIDRAQQASVLTRLGAVYNRWGRPQDAGAPLAQALAVARELGSSHYEAEVLTALSDVAILEGDSAKAREYCTQAYEIYASRADPNASELAERLKRMDEPPAR